jgi:alkylated DNA repair dioxygenase AlkB
MRILHEDTDGAQLIEHNFMEYSDLIDTIINQVSDSYLITPCIKVFGKEAKQPRDVQFRSNASSGYNYSNQCMQAIQLTTEMETLMTEVNRRLGSSYNGILFNIYTDGSKTVGAHSDSEKGLNSNAGVVSISYGTIRKFRIRDKKTKHMVGDYPTRHLRALQMKGPFQKNYTHEIPIQKKIKTERVSMTFREHTS